MVFHLRRATLLLLALILTAAATLVVSSVDADARPKPTPKGYDVLFIRHAEASPSSGPLSPLGLEQAATLAALLEDEPVRSVDTSVLLRAFQTGVPVASDHDLPVLADERINEVTFDLTGIPPTDINAVVGQRLASWLYGENRDEGYGGESFDDVQARFDSWWASYVAEHKTDKGTGVVVAHGALLILMVPELCANPVEPAFVLANGLANTSIIRARLHPNGTVSCTEWAGVPIPGATTSK